MLDEDDDGQVKTCFKTFSSKVENDDGNCYQGITLTKYELTIRQSKTVYASAISNICTKAEQRLSSFVKSVAFSIVFLLLDTKSWPKDDFVSFGNCEINKLTQHYMTLLKKSGCDVTKISSKWTRLKTYIFLILHYSPNKSYLEIWHQIFTNNKVMAECQNIMHIFKILMIVPFTNAILEHLFSRMNRSKQTFVTDYQDLDWMTVCESEKDQASRISSLMALSIVGQQRRKDVSSHVHIIILQISVFV